MAEFASKGVAGSALGLGIAGLSVALLNGGLGGLGGILGGGKTNANVASLNTKLAELHAEKYSDKVGIEVFKASRESDAKTNARFEEIARTIADMRVREAQTAGKIDLVAATANQGIAANSAAIACVQNTVAGVAKIVVPNSSICPGWVNVTITPATATTAG